MSIEKMGDEFMRKYGSKPVKRKSRKRKATSNQGWTDEPVRHSMASYGIKSGRKTRDYAPKQTFKSAPYIKAGVGFGVAGLGAGLGLLKSTGSFLAKKREEKLRKDREREEYLDGEIRTPLSERVRERVPFVRPIDNAIWNDTYYKAQLNAKRQKLDRLNEQRLKPLDIVTNSEQENK